MTGRAAAREVEGHCDFREGRVGGRNKLEWRDGETAGTEAPGKKDRGMKRWSNNEVKELMMV